MKQKILDYLILMNRPVKRRELLSFLHSEGIDTTDRMMRKEIEEAIRSGELIESSEKGYSLIKTEEEIIRAKKYLNEKIESLCIRRNCLERNWQTKILKTSNGQIQLFQ